MTSASLRPQDWTVDPLPSHLTSFAHGLVAEDSGTWRPLRQHWRGDTPETGFQASSARIFWTATALHYEVVLHGAGQHNTARQLNELTWDLGDVCEIFLCDVATRSYIELHVTPENHRLQLHFPFGAIDLVRAGNARIEDYMVRDPNWVETTVQRAENAIAVRVIIPAAIFTRHRAIDADSEVRTAVCRYDYRGRPGRPLLSSTAPLSGPSFHAPDEWARLIFHRA